MENVIPHVEPVLPSLPLNQDGANPPSEVPCTAVLSVPLMVMLPQDTIERVPPMVQTNPGTSEDIGDILINVHVERTIVRMRAPSPTQQVSRTKTTTPAIQV